MSFKELKIRELENKAKVLSLNPNIPETSGIYVFTRIDEDGIKYAYVGQAKHLLTRLAQHLHIGHNPQHIDLSIKKHGLYSNQNPSGWQIEFFECPESDLDDKERYYILDYALGGYQLRNKTAGGQNKGKVGIAENKPAKGYREGVKQGYENARRKVKHLFDLYLQAVIKADKPSKNAIKALEKFNDFLEGNEDG